MARAGAASADEEVAETAPLADDAPQEMPVLEEDSAHMQPEAEANPPEISSLELMLLALVNGARSSKGLRPLQWNAEMTAAARAHAADMASTGVVSHTGSDGSSPKDRLRRAGVEFRFASENIWTYWGRVPEAGPSSMHAAMMAEPFRPGLWNHVGNILYDGYRRIGIGIVVAARGVQYLSETFAD
jgi:uncharacterized protein YkwD